MNTIDQLKETIHQLAEELSNQITKDEREKKIFKQCFVNTADTTTEFLEDETSYIFTGDISAMWLRDSSAQVKHYLEFADKNQVIASYIKGLIATQFKYIEIDPYANAFNKEPNDHRDYKDDTKLNPWIWERKYEIDSLCYPIDLLYQYFKKTKDDSVFTKQVENGLHTIADLWIKEQHHEEQSDYYFHRQNCPPSDTLVNGVGTKTGYTGMTWSGFRPSDDACTYGYLIPSNMFAVVVLRFVEEIAKDIYKDQILLQKAEKLRQEIDLGIKQYGIYQHEIYGKIYAYEVDGLGNVNLMDDANVPSLLSIPFLGYTTIEDEIYQNTRKFILSKDNPYYYTGEAAAGIGSLHTPKRYIWPIALVIQALTTNDEVERKELLSMLLRTDANTGYMHEGFHVDDPNRFTREWFAWANSLYALLRLKMMK